MSHLVCHLEVVYTLAVPTYTCRHVPSGLSSGSRVYTYRHILLHFEVVYTLVVPTCICRHVPSGLSSGSNVYTYRHVVLHLEVVYTLAVPTCICRHVPSGLSSGSSSPGRCGCTVAPRCSLLCCTERWCPIWSEMGHNNYNKNIQEQRPILYTDTSSRSRNFGEVGHKTWILAVAFGGHLFTTIFLLAGGGGGAWPPCPPWIYYWILLDLFHL